MVVEFKNSVFLNKPNLSKKSINIGNKKDKFSNPSFGATTYHLTSIYKSAIAYHKKIIMGVDPERVENYFAGIGIPASFREGSNYARKFVAYGSYCASQIFRQLNFVQPTKIKLLDFERIGESPSAAGLCYWGSSKSIFRNKDDQFPIRTVLFNAFSKPIDYLLNGQNVRLNWENMFEILQNNKDTNFSSSGHFLSTFIHEFAHNLHFDNLFSKYGAPEQTQLYRYNPNVLNIILKLQSNIDEKNPYVSTNIKNMLTKEVSQYGGSSLPEAFAEAFTDRVLMNIDLFKLRLVKNPFPINSKNQSLTQIMYEIYEGLVGDGKGLI